MAGYKDAYDVEAAFEAIEEQLIASMMRNMRRHRVDEIHEGKQWEMWQALQLESLEQYKKANRKKFSKEFSTINSSIDDMINRARKQGSMEQELEILDAIKNGFKGHKRVSSTMQGQFFKMNTRKMNALIRATKQDMAKAEHAILRKANDEYRKAIFNAQVYANSGAGTYAQAVDMATKDMLSRGLTCVEYKNGAQHSLSSYAAMAIRTANKRAILTGEGEKRQEWGISTVIVAKRSNPCPKCLPFLGKVLIDDVWSGGKASDGKYPLMSAAMAAGLYHPNCKDKHSTYFPGISTPPDDNFSKEELARMKARAEEEAKQKHAQRQADKYNRMARHSLDPDTRAMYAAKRDEWKNNMKMPMEKSTEKGYTIRTAEEFEIEANKMKSELSTYAKNPSKWSGKIIVDNQGLEKIGAKGAKDWSCDITLRDDVDDGTMWHELLHSCSASYYDFDTYDAHGNIEEASVDFLKHQICKEKGIQSANGYQDFVGVLEEINGKFKYGSDLEFAKELFNIPLPDRYQWLEDKVHDSLKIFGASFEDYNDVMLCVWELKGGRNG